MNELLVNILRCSNLNGLDGVSKPSAYCSYTFFNSPQHTTSIAAVSKNPEFNDEHGYPVRMDTDLDSYLAKKPLEVFVYDKNDPTSAGTAYLGVAKIPLNELKRDRHIIESYELLKV